MISMKIYDRKEGQNIIEILPLNSEGLVNILYGKNKNRVSLNKTEVYRLLTFLTNEYNIMQGSNVKDSISKT